MDYTYIMKRYMFFRYVIKNVAMIIITKKILQLFIEVKIAPPGFDPGTSGL